MTQVRTVTLPGKQVRYAKVEAWAEAEGVRIVRRVRRLPSDPGTWSVEVEVATATEAEGVRMAVEGTWGRYGFKPEVVAAIEGGLLTDADPTWWAQDIGASTKVAFTEAGRALAFGAGWMARCKCPSCRRDVGTIGMDLRWRGWCSGCYSSGSQFSFYDDECGFHYKSRHPEAVLPRGRR